MIRRADRARRLYSVPGLKACPLCGTLATLDAPECFVCRWGGAFEHDEGLVDSKVLDLVRSCPELGGLLERPRAPHKFVQFWQALWSRLLSKLDVSA